MEWKRPALYAVLVAAVLVASAFLVYPLFVPDRNGRDHRAEGAFFDVNGVGIWATGRAGGEKLQVMVDGEWTDLLVKGVNIGVTKPGYFPGEAAIKKEEYARWLDDISDMNANAIRVYTHHPPGLYQALLEHNRARPDPLYLFQGVTIDEELIVKVRDAFDEDVLDDRDGNLMDCIDIIHGNANIRKDVGRAYGIYDADVSEYVLGLIIGIEMDPVVVNHTDVVHAGIDDLDGTYFRTAGASPTEVWLASAMELAAAYETDTYGTQRPLSFVNWPTTDPMDHDYEPSYYEDLVGIDQGQISSTDNFYPGQFASFHVYPYYPDFMNLEPAYLNYTDERGRPSNYAAYLRDLKGHVRMPILVAEFGTPSSRGIAHRNVFGIDHGGMTEWQQGQYGSFMFQDIVDEGMAGGLLFSWQDEWFKRAWNTMDRMDPGRRPYWFDVQTCEQNFGVLRFEPVSEHMILIDGEVDDWRGIEPLMVSDPVYNVYPDGYDEGRDLRRLYAWSDAAYLYLRIDYKDLYGSPNWEAMNTVVLLDTIPGQGITHVPFGTQLGSARGIDFMVHLNGSGSRVLVDSYYDANYYDYAVEERLLPLEPYMNRSDNGVFHRIELTTSRGFTVWPTREVHPFQSYETGALRWGISDRDDYAFDPLADIYAGDECIEMRLPWLMLNFRDPSRRIVLPDLWKDGLHSGLKVEGIYLAAATFKPGPNGASVAGENSPPIADSMPLARDGILQEADFGFYTWDEWSVPVYREVLKESYYLMQEEYGNHP